MIMPRLRLHAYRDAKALAAEPAMESIYRDLFLREFAALGVSERFFPVGGAANYGLLYLILRIGLEHRPRSVLDIGAGQSSLLWSMLQRHGAVGTVLTLEDDPTWATHIAAQVDHPLCVTPLRPRRIGVSKVRTYDWDHVREHGPFDVIVCDGPRGTPRRSRIGIVELLRRPPEDFVVVLDDAERPGEQDTVRAIHDTLRRAGCDYQVGVTRAATTQVVFAAGRYLPATYL